MVIEPWACKEAKTKSAGGTKLTLGTEGSASSICARPTPDNQISGGLLARSSARASLWNQAQVINYPHSL